MSAFLGTGEAIQPQEPDFRAIAVSTAEPPAMRIYATVTDPWVTFLRCDPRVPIVTRLGYCGCAIGTRGAPKN
jgi:hypothetical protein